MASLYRGIFLARKRCFASRLLLSKFLKVIKYFVSWVFFFLFLPFHSLPLGYESASASSVCEPCKGNKSRHSEEVVHAKVFSKRNREQLEKIIKYSRSTEMSSGILF